MKNFLIIDSNDRKEERLAPNLESVIKDIFATAILYSNGSLLKEDYTHIYEQYENRWYLVATIDPLKKYVLSTHTIKYWTEGTDE